jgi:hypothetical protein
VFGLPAHIFLLFDRIILPTPECPHLNMLSSPFASANEGQNEFGIHNHGIKEEIEKLKQGIASVGRYRRKAEEG